MNNAGGTSPDPQPTATCTQLTQDNFSYIMATNFESGYHLSQLVYPLFKASEAGNIIFISSVSSFMAFDTGAAYGAGKGVPFKSIFHFLLIYNYFIREFEIS